MADTLICDICKEAVTLEESKTDERGKAVHENCYIWTVELKKPAKGEHALTLPTPTIQSVVNGPALRAIASGALTRRVFFGCIRLVRRHRRRVA